MPAVLLHGVPEQAALWDLLISKLQRRDVVALRLPGFGCARPAGFGATKEEYVMWLAGELERLGADGPIDLVGHDWGGGFTVRLVSTRPELVRSWVSDAAGLADVHFEWHDFAKIWQTPGAGEEFFAQQLATPSDQRGAVFEAFGVPAEQAAVMGTWPDQTMADCILSLYRSAVDVGREWAPDFRNIAAPGMVIIPSDDPFLSIESATRGATGAGAAIAHVNGVGHWWMLQDPARGARLLEDFWASLP